MRRSAAEALLAGWEADAAPGFLGGLLRIVEQTQTVPTVRASLPLPLAQPLSPSPPPPPRSNVSKTQEFRMLAAIVAKNAVGSSWRKTLGSREWSRVPDEEKAAVRTGTLQLLLTGQRSTGRGIGPKAGDQHSELR